MATSFGSTLVCTEYVYVCMCYTCLDLISTVFRGRGRDRRDRAPEGGSVDEEPRISRPFPPGGAFEQYSAEKEGAAHDTIEPILMGLNMSGM